MDILAYRIKERREELGLSQDDLAKKLGYKSRSTIAKIETGENDIPYSKTKSFAEALDVSEAWLMGHESDLVQEFNEEMVLESYLKLLGWTYRHVTFTDGLNCNECIDRQAAKIGFVQKSNYPDGNYEPFCEHCKLKDAYYIFTNGSVSFNVPDSDFHMFVNKIRLITKEQIQLLFQNSTKNLFSDEIK